MKKILVCFVAASLLLISSCGSSNSLSRSTELMEEICLTLGGGIIVYTPEANIKTDTVSALYGVSGELPDEFAFLEFAVIWYSRSSDAADAAVFYSANATDTASIEKMCARRKKTVKRTTGTDMKIVTKEHFVCIYTDGIPILEDTINKIITK